MVKVVIKSFLSFLLACLIMGTPMPKMESRALAATAMTTTNASPSITIKGKIKFIDVEGGCYQLITTNNTHYELQGEFPRQDGLIVKVQGTVAPDLVTACQVGQPLQVQTIKVLKNR
jgi:hypothetical protein